MSLSDTIDKSEKLYRVVKRSTPNCLTSSRKATPALFKDPNGVSVDRDGGRPEEESVQFMKDFFGARAKAIGKVTADLCFIMQAEVSYDPKPNNPFHTLVWLDKENENHRNLQALQLADQCEIVKVYEDVQWNEVS